MGLHHLCDQCQRLCHARPTLIDESDLHEFTYPFSSKNSRYYVFCDPIDPSNPSLPTPVSTISLKTVIQSAWKSRKFPNEKETSPILTDHGFSHLRKAIQEGCHLCHLLFPPGTIEEVPEEGSEVYFLVGIPMLFVWGSGPMFDPNDFSHSRVILKVEFFHGETPGFAHNWEYPLLTVDLRVRLTADLPKPIVSADDEMIYGFRKKTIEQTRNWIENCQHHDLCNNPYVQGKHVSHTRLPTRLLDISMSSGAFQIRLVETNSNGHEIQTDSNYATLSHCWGAQGVTMKLLMSNISTYQMDVPFEKLPRTFRDAVVFCHLLGIRYLWIDALCIIQGVDNKDWEREAPRMYHVYAGAVVNFAASVSTSCNGGLLVQDNLLTPCYLRTVWGACEASSQFTVGFDEDECDRSIENAALNERSWVFQERLLSARTIHFCQDQLWLQCRKSSYAECFGTGYPVSLKRPSNVIIQSVEWSRLVEKYAETMLTFESDRLAALSGIAQAFMVTHALEPDDYIAGLWRPSLFDGLCWNTEHGKRGRNSVAPTWSWASTLPGSRVVWEHTYWPGHESEKHPALEIQDVSLHSNPATPFNHTRRGSLRIQGAISKAKISRVYTGESPMYYCTERINPRLDLTTDQRGLPSKERIQEKRGCHDAVYICIDEETVQIEGSILHLWPMRKRCQPYYKKDTEYAYTAMLLERVSGRQGTYQRIGWVSVNVPDKMSGYKSGDIPSWWCSGTNLPDDDFLETYNNGVYSIDIL